MSKKRFRVASVVLVAVALGVACYGFAATSTDELGGESGKYSAGTAAPDSLTSTKPGKVLKVTGGSGAPDRTFDQGRVKLTAKNGATAVFSGRSTSWGCTYSVAGVYVGGDGPLTTWGNTFEEKNEPRIALEVNGPGTGDDIVLLGDNGGTLHVNVLGVTENVSVTLSTNHSGEIELAYSSVTVVAGTTKDVSLKGLAVGEPTITATATVDGKNLSASIKVKVQNFRGKIKPDDDFAGRSLEKLGVGETGSLGVELAPGTNLGDLIDLKWRVSGRGVILRNIDPKKGTAEFTASDTPGEATLSLTDKNGNKFTITIAVIKPTGAYQVKTKEGNFPGFCGVYMINQTYLLPKDVSFWKIKVNEGECKAETEGSLDEYNEPHKAGFLLSDVSKSKGITKGCLLDKLDTVGCRYPLDIAAGTLEWDIPWLYSVGGVVAEEFTRLLHRIVVDGNKKATVSKGGVTAEHPKP
ncbi:MAG: hypothetical protein K8S55_14205 [Phycisphaerae bacterium]|nr:hypothetical protein [Phycisphaerae bacterium]